MNKNKFEIISNSVSQTIDLGRSLGQILKGGEIIAMIGTLGTGKTHFIKGIAQGLQVNDPDAVTSPTFTLINEYEGRLPLYHIDAYRLDNAWQLESLGFDEICTSPAVIVVEWADRVETLISAYNPIRIQLAHLSESKRTIQIQNIPDHIKDKIKHPDPAHK